LRLKSIPSFTYYAASGTEQQSNLALEGSNRDEDRGLPGNYAQRLTESARFPPVSPPRQSGLPLLH
jgi:hypothetical protein